MTLALIDCPTGLAGNMLLAALLDLGVPQAVIEAPLAALGLEGAYRLELEERRSGGLRGLHLQVESLEPQPSHRHWSSLRPQLEQAPWPLALRQRVLRVFSLLAEAEGAVHGHPPEQVHFHEVGALDALVDVVGTCAALLHLEVEQLVCTPPPLGHGSVSTAHGVLPVPPPAVLELACRHAVPLAGCEGFPAGELTTPTGLALAVGWADRFAVAPPCQPRGVGVGLGSRSLDRPNLLRVLIADPAPQEAAELSASGLRLETVLLQQAQLDDMSAEDLAFLVQRLQEAGALDVFSQAVAMKKGRSGVLVTAIVDPASAADLRQVWWKHASTLGLREQWQRRWALPRQIRTLQTSLGEVRIKQVQRPDGRITGKPEHDDLQRLARLHNCSIAEVRELVMRTWQP